MLLSNNSEEEFVLRKMFNEFDTNGNGTLSIDELGAMLAKLSLSVERKYIMAMLNMIDTNGSG